MNKRLICIFYILFAHTYIYAHTHTHMYICIYKSINETAKREFKDCNPIKYIHNGQNFRPLMRSSSVARRLLKWTNDIGHIGKANCLGSMKKCIDQFSWLMIESTCMCIYHSIFSDPSMCQRRFQISRFCINRHIQTYTHIYIYVCVCLCIPAIRSGLFSITKGFAYSIQASNIA